MNMYEMVRLAALESRPVVTDLPAREALVEFMIRVSLGQVDEMIVPSEHKDAARKLRRLISSKWLPDSEEQNNCG